MNRATPLHSFRGWALLFGLLLSAILAGYAVKAFAEEDAVTSATSTSGASANFQVKAGTVIVLQSQACAFHYRACTSSSCTALQTDLYVKQYDAWPVQLTSDRTYIAVACDGTSTGVVYQYAMVVP